MKLDYRIAHKLPPELFWAVEQSVKTASRVNQNLVRLITTDKSDMPTAEWPDFSFVGLTHQDNPYSAADIWVSPNYPAEHPNLLGTVVHEVAHAYVGVNAGHDEFWDQTVQEAFDLLGDHLQNRSLTDKLKRSHVKYLRRGTYGD